MTGPQKEAWRGRLRLIGSVVGLVVLVAQLALWLPAHARRADADWMDFSVYLRAARHVAAGEPLYAECADFVLGERPSCFYYPPVLALALAPVARLGPAAFQVVWYGGIVVAFWLYAFGLARLARVRTSLPNVLAAGALLQLTPGLTTTMSFGNVDLWVWALCALALGGLRSRPLLAVGALVKVFPGWAVAVSLARRERRAWVALVVGAVGLGLAALVVGPRALLDWTGALAVMARGFHLGTNVSLTVLALGAAERVGLGGHAAAFLVAAPLVGVPVVAFATRRWPVERSLAAVLVASVLLAPLCWLHYAPILLIPAAACWRERSAVTGRAAAAPGTA